MFTDLQTAKIKEYYNLALDTLKTKNIRKFKNCDTPIMCVSGTYPGIYLEHLYDSVLFATLEDEYIPLAKDAVDLFIKHQTNSGQLPCFIKDSSVVDETKEAVIGYSQIQECVAFGALAFEVYKLSGDVDFLERAYTATKKWVMWLKNNRMTLNTGLVEMFVGFDTGHDNSPRLNGMKNKGCRFFDNGIRMGADTLPDSDDVAPITAVDLNCTFYHNHISLYNMANELSLFDEAREWQEKAQAIKDKLFSLCFNADDTFFYDLDKFMEPRIYVSSTILHLFLEGVLSPDKDSELIKKIYHKHIKNPDEFWTKVPFPSMSVSDPSTADHKDCNCWGYYSQALIALRCIRWMDNYGMSDDFLELLNIWVTQWTFNNTLMFGQELDPISGRATDCSEWYSSCMLLYVYAVRRLGLLND